MTGQTDTLNVSLLQMDIIWENKEENLKKIKYYIEKLAGKTDLLVLPEMFSTGFSMNTKNLAETNDGSTLTTLKKWSQDYNIALCGSYMAKEKGKNYNRAFFITPQNAAYYDKRHLFRMGDEANHYSEGNGLPIIHYKGFNICMQICYDLRFPVWSRNVDNKYDLLIYVANWPQSRIMAWDALLTARAIENQAYVCGVNRVGIDRLKLFYNGHSTMLDYKGISMIDASEIVNKEICLQVTINKKELNLFRNKFPVWKDADKFTLSIRNECKN